MKYLLHILLLSTLLSLPAFPNYTTQTVITVYCKESPPQIKPLQYLLSQGWNIVNSTPVLQTRQETISYNNYIPITFTAYIIYVLQKEIIESPYAKHHREEQLISNEDQKYIKVEKEQSK